jgi:hypothetical protein
MSIDIKAVKEAITHSADSISRKRNGNIIIRKTFYYRHGTTADSFLGNIEAKLQNAGIDYTVVDYGEVWKPFKGGSTIANSSHWFVEIK